MSSSRRVQRVQSILRSELSRLLLEEVSDPRLSTIGITDVKVTSDLKLARVYYESRHEDTKSIEAALKTASSFLRRKIGEQLEMRFTPELHFYLDKHTNEVNRILNLMSSMHQPASE